MTDPRSMLDELAVPFPPHAIEKREGAGGRMLDYVATETVIRRLNNTVGVWDFRVTAHEWRPPFTYTDRNNRERTEQTLMVWGEMTIPGLGTRSGVGVQVVEITRGNEDMMKGAASDCLKKCATQFGVGIDLYGPDLEAGELPQQAKPQQLPPRARNASQNTVPQNQPQQQRPAPQQNGPQQPPQQAQQPQARAGVPPSEKQFNMVHGIKARMGWTDDDLHSFAGVESLNEIDRQQMSSLIDALMQKERSGDHTPPGGNEQAGSEDYYNDLPF